MQVQSSAGGTVNVTLLGAHDVAKMIWNVTNEIVDQTKLQLLNSATYAVYEVQASIKGERGEPKSVDTGNFANSIQAQPVSDNSVSVFSEVEYAPFLEYGTIYMEPRAHFQNTAFRIEPNLKEEFNAVITKICDKNK